jgi:dipeptide transport system ATP-binding protein
VLVADEPTSALDVSIQAQVLNLLMDLQDEFNTAYVFVSHNLAVVEHVAHYVMVMYLGRVVETGPKANIFAQPLHPYTQALLSATPSIDAHRRQKKIPIVGELPSPLNPPSGCAFHKRCPYADARCAAEEPQLRLMQQQQVACHHVEKLTLAA